MLGESSSADFFLLLVFVGVLRNAGGGDWFPFRLEFFSWLCAVGLWEGFLFKVSGVPVSSFFWDALFEFFFFVVFFSNVPGTAQSGQEFC